MEPQITRRSLLRGVAATAAFGSGAAVVGGCSSSGTKDTGNANAKATLPTYKPRTVVKYDLPAGPNGAPPAALFSYPTDPPAATTATPATSGQPITIFTAASAVPPPLAKNAMWQALNKALGAPLQFTWAIDDYDARFATLVAGGKLPDLLLAKSYSTPNFQALAKAKFEDLTPYVGGDKVLAYPNLANNPPDAWKTQVFGGAIYGVPFSALSPSVFNMMGIRKDVAQAKGLDPQPTSGAEFLSLCKALANPRANQWAIALPGTALSFLLACLEAPNRWQINSDGSWTRDYETPQYTQALGILADMWKGQLFHPDSFSGTFDDGAALATSKTSLEQGSWGNLCYMVANYKKQYPQLEMAAIKPPKWGGGGFAKTFQTADASAGTVIQKGLSPDRIRELLRVLDWMHSPVGSKEYLLKQYGVEGVDYTITGAGPVPTKQGGFDANIALNYVGSPPIVNTWPPGPGMKDVITATYDYYKATAPTAVANPGLFLYSATAVNKEARLTTNMTNTVNDIIQGRQPVSSWADAVTTWKSEGGDKMRKEYQEAHAAAH